MNMQEKGRDSLRWLSILLNVAQWFYLSLGEVKGKYFQPKNAYEQLSN